MNKYTDCFCYIDEAVTSDCSGNVEGYVGIWGNAVVKLCRGHYKEFFL